MADSQLPAYQAPSGVPGLLSGIDPLVLKQLMAHFPSDSPQQVQSSPAQPSISDKNLAKIALDQPNRILYPDIPGNMDARVPQLGVPPPVADDPWANPYLFKNKLATIVPATNSIVPTVAQTTETNAPALTTANVLKNTGMAIPRMAGGAVKGALSGLLNARSFGDAFKGPVRGAAKGLSDAGRVTLSGYGLNIPAPTNAPPTNVTQKIPFFRRLIPFGN